jgi:membrane associated rhomboid family serine protease
MDVNYKNKKYTFQLGMGQGLTKGVTIIGGLSIVVFIVTQFNRDIFYPLLGFVPSFVLGKMMFWQFITANFMHADLNHLLFNMFGLYMFGVAVEKKLKEREFIEYFLVCGVGGYLLAFIFWCIGIIPNNLIVGASAGVYGLLLAFSLLYPNQKILLFFAIPMQAKWLAILFGVAEFLLSFRNNGISHIGHFGGIVAGVGYFMYKKKITFTKGTIIV